MIPPTPQTPRRSGRLRGELVPTKKFGEKLEISAAWTTQPVHTRPLNTEKDLNTSDQEIYDELKEQGESGWTTSIHDSFDRSRKSLTLQRGSKRKVVETETETFRVGDTVLVAGNNIGIIAAAWETNLRDNDARRLDQKMLVGIHWFVKPNQLAAVRKQREHVKNEIYFTVDSCTKVEVGTIVKRCAILPVRDAGDEGDSDSDDEDESAIPKFYCRYAVDARTGLFFDFSWADHKASVLQQLKADPTTTSTSAWIIDIPKPKKRPAGAATAKRARFETNDDEPHERDDDSGDEKSDGEYTHSGGEEESDGGGDMDEDEDAEDDAVGSDGGPPRTPSRKRKRGQTSNSPRKRLKGLAHPTPHSKRRLQASPSKHRKFTRIAQPTYAANDTQDSMPEDPYLRAMHVLHVGSRPEVLPCREGQFDQIFQGVGALLEEGSGGCVYVSGLPGTGKTATVHAVIRQLKRMAEENETNPFTFVEINGLRVPEPQAAYTELWQTLSNHDVKKEGRMTISAKESLKHLTGYFHKGEGRGPAGHACIVLMDELDQLVTAKQDVIYNFFNWPTLSNSQLIVIAVANTHDLPERVMTGRVRSRLGMTRISYNPYQKEELIKIVLARLKSASIEPNDSGPVIALPAIVLTSAKVSNLSGDARRMLDVCRRAVEMVRETQGVAGTKQVLAVMRDMQSTPTAAYLRELSFHERVMLAAMIKCVRREGVEEIKWGDLQYQHMNLVPALAGIDVPQRRPSRYELGKILESLACSRTMVVEEGAAAMKKAEDERKVVLNLEQGEVERALVDAGGDVWKIW